MYYNKDQHVCNVQYFHLILLAKMSLTSFSVIISILQASKMDLKQLVIFVTQNLGYCKHTALSLQGKIAFRVLLCRLGKGAPPIGEHRTRDWGAASQKRQTFARTPAGLEERGMNSRSPSLASWWAGVLITQPCTWLFLLHCMDVEDLKGNVIRTCLQH